MTSDDHDFEWFGSRSPPSSIFHSDIAIAAMQLYTLPRMLCLTVLSSFALPQPLVLEDQLTLLDVCPKFTVRCVKDGDWAHPVGELEKKRAPHLPHPLMHSRRAWRSGLIYAVAFCREGIRCNQCDIKRNSELRPRSESDVQGLGIANDDCRSA